MLPDLLAPLIAGRRVCVIASPQLAAALPQATPVPSHTFFDSETFGVIVSTDPAELGASFHCAPDAIHVLVGALPALQDEPPARFRAHAVIHPLSGLLLANPGFPGQRAVRLCDGLETSPTTLHLVLWSSQPLPELTLGLHTQPGRHPQPHPQHPSISQRAAPQGAGRAQAVRLARRLQAVEERTLALRAEIQRLQQAAAGGASHANAAIAFDIPRTRQPWPLAEAPRTEPITLGLYDRRPDDEVLVEAAAGEAFFTRFGLDGSSPDSAGAIAALNATMPALNLNSDVPDASIVIPVHGQLAYTLNTIDSLLHHASTCSAEIIIIDDASPDPDSIASLPRIGSVRLHRTPTNIGFIAACNTGAGLARGRYVILLNSDVRVVAGWLDALMQSFTLFPNAGLVGSKMFFPDGSLQEAGGILWRNGAAWNYGRGDDPNRPQYCYARQVDYISGCSIALPLTLWRDLHGFDAHFAPAYAEDADLAQRVRAAGHEVWFQPLSRVLHYEGKTSGTDTGTGVKAWQVVNLKKLFVRWREDLATHRRYGDNPFMERERTVRKRLLVIDAVTPTPDQDAGSVQTVLALRCARLEGYKPHFVPEDNWLFVTGYTPDLQREGIDCTYAPYQVGFESYIRRYGWLFNVIITYRVAIMDRCLALLRIHAPQAALIFHVSDLHHLRMRRQAVLEANAEGERAADAVRDMEFGVIQRADCTITHSPVEASIIAAALPNAAVVTWPLMTHFAGTTTPHAARRDICFLGGYRHPPNVDAVTFFARAVLPQLRAAEAGLRFIVAGANPTSEIEALASDDIIVTGKIADLRNLFDATRVFVCPLRVGAGVKGKVVSALSYGVPVVSTGIGVEGAGLTDGIDVLVADNPAEMIEAILRLYRDPILWTRLSEAGQARVRRDFSIDMGRAKLNEAIEQAWRHKHGLTHAG